MSRGRNLLEIAAQFAPRRLVVGLVSFCNDAASELVYPLVPLYLASVLLAGPRALGLIEGIAEATGESACCLPASSPIGPVPPSRGWWVVTAWRRWPDRCSLSPTPGRRC